MVKGDHSCPFAHTSRWSRVHSCSPSPTRLTPCRTSLPFNRRARGFDEIYDWIYFYENVATATPVTPTPAQATLEQNHPNPFNPTTAIRFELSRDAEVTLAVYDVDGALVSRVAQGRYPAGSHEVRWNATDMRGKKVASGVNFYRLMSGNTELTRKMVLLK